MLFPILAQETSRNVSFPTLCTHAPIQKIICPGGGERGISVFIEGGGAARHKCDNFTPKLTNINFRGGGSLTPLNMCMSLYILTRDNCKL